jgi:hypothetical protein
VGGVAELPQPRVLARPDRAQEAHAVGDPLGRTGREHVPAPDVLPEGLDEIAKATQLKLASSLVSQVHGGCASVAGEGQLLLVTQRLPGECVDRIDPGLGVGHGVEQPVH